MVSKLCDIKIMIEQAEELDRYLTVWKGVNDN